LKLSLLIFYQRLTSGVGEKYRIRVNIGFGFLAVSFVAIITNLYLACRPFHKYWQINPDPEVRRLNQPPLALSCR
jgi:hypothetical protein